ncbi:MAG TPA: ion channel [Candidatus Binatia bacterium]|jgi:hypothetical protein
MFQRRHDLLLLVYLVLLIIVYPLLDQGTLNRSVFAMILGMALLLAMLSVSVKEGPTLPMSILFGVAFVLRVIDYAEATPILQALQWGALTLFFGFAVRAMFVHLFEAKTISDGHLYASASGYLFLALLWFAMYQVIETLRPGSFVTGGAPAGDHPSVLLYFSIVTLTTVGYGDIVPVWGLARMLAAVEAMIGVLYIAITVALLVGRHHERPQ